MFSLEMNNYFLIPTILFCIFGGLGSVCRCVATRKISLIYKNKKNVPVATLFINIAASFALGVATNLILLLSYEIFSVFAVSIVTGFLGGFSTFSTAIFEGVNLIQNKRIKNGIFLLFAELLMPLLAASFGYVGSQILLTLFI